MPRRLLLLTAALLCLMYSACLLVSFGKNRKLANDVKQASQVSPRPRPPAGEAASLDSLKRLETLRQSLQVSPNYNRNGAPWGYPLGPLYRRDDLYPDVHKLYFANFCRVAARPYQETIVASLHSLPGRPGAD